MLFSSTTFLFSFLPIVIIVYYTLLRKSRKLQNIFLLIVSLVFYAWGEPTFVLIMLASIIINYFAGLIVSKNNKYKKPILILSIIFNIGLLFVFKYLAFSITTINSIFNSELNIPSIALPIGISFFTFQAMSYVIDVYRGEKVQKNPLYVGLYITFFPQLIAGPIVRYQTIADQIENRNETLNGFANGVCRFIIGLAKKVLIANTMAVIADKAFSSDTSLISLGFAWLGALAYAFQILFDFSGYSDMAIGLGLMFGFKFLENFNYPYISSSITEFWRRWHISLGSWFRDYVYFPMGGSRVDSKLRLVFNLFVVWTLTGIWHGANLTFLLWGFLYFVILSIEKLTGLAKTKKLPVLRHIYTLLFVLLGWVLFRSDNITYAFSYIKAMFVSNGNIFDNYFIFFLKENFIFFIFAIIVSTPLIRILYNKLDKKKLSTNIIITVAFLLLSALVIIYLVKSTYNPFIYFNF